MSRASQAPYYLIMSIYLGVNAFLWFMLNQTVTGNMSDVYLVSSLVAGLTCASGIFYAFAEDDGNDTTSADVMIPFIQLTIPKWFYYIASIVVMAARLWFGYQSNHNATGIESLWGYVWIVATLIVFFATLPNAKLYFKTRSVASKNRSRLAELEAMSAKMGYPGAIPPASDAADKK
jgi:hypothetical protein